MCKAWQPSVLRSSPPLMRLRDRTSTITLTLWGEHAEAAGAELEEAATNHGYAVLAAKNLKIGDFNGRNLGTIYSSQLFVEPTDQFLPGIRT